MKRTEAKTVGEIIEQVIVENHLDEDFYAQKACFVWAQVVGQNINRLTTRRFVAGKSLHVFINGAALKNELTFVRHRLVTAINEAVGRDVINDIVIH